jgi:ABC-2 type transport system permease protein
VSSLVERENLLRKVQFPRMAVPVATVLTSTFNLMLNILVVLGLALASGVPVRLSWLELPVLLGCLALLATGLAMLLSSLYVRFRDVRPIWEVLLQVLFYGTPVIYAIETIHLSDTFKHAVMSNPVAVVLQQARHAVIDRHAPSAVQAIGGWGHMIVPAAISIGIVALGAFVFVRWAPDLAERL